MPTESVQPYDQSSPLIFDQIPPIRAPPTPGYQSNSQSYNENVMKPSTISATNQSRQYDVYNNTIFDSCNEIDGFAGRKIRTPDFVDHTEVSNDPQPFPNEPVVGQSMPTAPVLKEQPVANSNSRASSYIVSTNKSKAENKCSSLSNIFG